MLSNNQQTILMEVIDEIRAMLKQEIRTSIDETTKYPHKLLALKNIDALKSIENTIWQLLGQQEFYDEKVLPMWWIMIESLHGKSTRYSGDTPFLEHQPGPVQISTTSKWVRPEPVKPLSTGVDWASARCPCGNELTDIEVSMNARNHNNRLLCAGCADDLAQQQYDDERSTNAQIESVLKKHPDIDVGSGPVEPQLIKVDERHANIPWDKMHRIGGTDE